MGCPDGIWHREGGLPGGNSLGVIVWGVYVQVVIIWDICLGGGGGGGYMVYVLEPT